MTTFKSVAKVIGITFVVLVVGGTIYQQVATKRDALEHRPVGKMVDIGGCKLHILDSRVGKATVVIDSSIGEKTLDWCLVQPEIARFARVITYDRAGYAWSDVSALPRTSENIVKELHTMLHNANIPAPYILVGDSFGGMNVCLFANMYPEEVAGLVLVNSYHEDLFDKIPTLSPNKLSLNLMTMASYAGIFRLLDVIPMMHKKMDLRLGKYPEFLRKICLLQNLSTKYVNTMMQEDLCLQESCQQLKLHNQSFGDKPLTLITTQKPFVVGVSPCNKCTQAQIDSMNEIWMQLQVDLLQRSSRSKQIVINNSESHVSYNQPQVIVQAVRDMVLPS